MKNLCISLCILLILSLFSGCQQNETSDTQFYLDTICTIRAGGKNAKEAISAAFDRIADIQKAVDYYDYASTVSAINRAEAGVPVPLDNDTFSILKTTKMVAEASGGAFSITIAPVKDLWGFEQERPSVPADSEIKNTLQYVNDTYLFLNEQQKSVTKAETDVKIDLGGAAKGYAADQVLKLLKTYSLSYAVIDLGGNVTVWGKNPNSADGRWSVGIQKPFGGTGEYVQSITLSEGSVVTSGTYQRNFSENGKLYHHILNPATGYPAENQKNSATIIADSSALADCLSTACMVLPEEEAIQLANNFNVQLYFH